MNEYIFVNSSIFLIECLILGKKKKKKEQTMPQTLKATPEKYLIVVVQMQCKATISKCLPEILLGHVQNSVETHILNCLGVYLFSKPVCNPFFFAPFPTTNRDTYSLFFCLCPFLFFSPLTFAPSPPQRVEKVALTIN